MVEAWVKHNTEAGFDFLQVEWSANGTAWHPIDGYSGRNAGYPKWDRLTLGLDSPGGDVRVRFRFTSDLIISALTGATLAGARVDEVLVGKQAS